jgi:hypothetical protein
MNKLFLAVCIVFCIVLSSCEDIVNSENNINKTKITYNYVKSDQEHGVIMPLKVGNKWIYKVTDFNSSGIIQKNYLDSIVVNEEVQINGEKWFKVRFPLINENYDILMTNTDVGLLYKCDICSDVISLLAQYPVTSKEYISNSHKNMYLVVDANGKTINEQNIKVNSMVNVQSSIHTFYGNKNYDAIGYNVKDKYEENPKLYTIDTYQYVFVPDNGPFEIKIYRNPNEQITYVDKLFELVKYSGLQSHELMQNTFEIDFGDVPLGGTKNISVNLVENNTNDTIMIRNIIIINQSGVFDIQGKSQNIIMLPATQFQITVGCQPVARGIYESTMQIITDSEIMEVKLIYNCI